MKKSYLLTITLLITLLIYANAAFPPHTAIHALTEKHPITSCQDDKNTQHTISEKDIERYKQQGYVQYSNFGATGNGKTDDIDAIVATHAFANQNKLEVKADDGASYYISGKERTAIIKTPTDFGKATFIIDDRKVENRRAAVFEIKSNFQPAKVDEISSLKRDQKKVALSFAETNLLTVTDSNVKRYIRFGRNQNNGAAQTDIFVVDENGNVDMDSPIIWDFEQITSMEALPIDTTLLIVKGGKFTTIANHDESKYNYYSRNISISRSNVLIDGVEHRITGEEDHGAPYGGFINIHDCAYVTVKNTVLTGHKTYHTIGSAGKTVPMGSYDILVNRALNVSFINCSQTNSIDNRTYWGIMGSNYSKNLLFDACVFSRFDAHMGVANATIRNSTLGHMGINAIGTGTFLVENSTVRGGSFMNLRNDYGSTWEGEFVIRNCVFIPSGGRTASANLISGKNTGQHDFGYTCYMPEQITIDNLHIDDSNHPEGYRGPAIFSNFNPEMTDANYVEQFPYIKTKKVLLKNITTASKLSLRICDNPYLFKDVEVVKN